MRNLRTFQKIVRAVSLVGQLGFMVITPPLVLIFLAHLLQTRCGWGGWAILAAIALVAALRESKTLDKVNANG